MDAVICRCALALFCVARKVCLFAISRGTCLHTFADVYFCWVAVRTPSCRYRKQGKLDKAISFYEKDLAITIKVHGEEHSDVATSYNNLGLV